MNEILFTLMGPTASGKTALALELCEEFPFEIISVDSAMIYRGMDIGTAKPSLSEQRLCPHHLIDIRNPDESFSAFEFCQEVERLCQEIKARGKKPLLVGGTMMYFHALEQGLNALPQADEALRSRLEVEAKTLGLNLLHQRLQEVDPLSAAKIHAHDHQRIQRALEVYYLTGNPLSQLIAEKRQTNLRLFNLILYPRDRAWLHERIEERFHLMLEQGFIDEVRRLLEQSNLSLEKPALRCVGYRQAYDYLSGLEDYTNFVAKGIAATRQLAKRQLTWLKSWPSGSVFFAENAGVGVAVKKLMGATLKKL